MAGALFLLGTSAGASGSSMLWGGGSLADALHLVARKTATGIMFEAGDTVGHDVPAMLLDGDVRVVLDRLLRGSGLRYRFVGAHTILVERIPKALPRPPTPLSAMAPGDILVTAMRRPTRLADTPVSMVAVTGIELERAGATSLSALAALAPSLTMTNLGSGLNRLSLRGSYAAGEPTVGLYYGNVPVAGPSGSTSDPSVMTPDLALVDIERVEVLRGPQGTLYGSGSLAGTVRILFRHPELASSRTVVELSGAGTRGGAASGSASAIINRPLISGKLGWRVVAYRDVRGGVIDNVQLRQSNVDRQVRTGVRAALRWQWSPDWLVDLSGAYQKSHIGDSQDAEIGLPPYITAAPAKSPFTDDFFLINAELHGRLGKVGIDATIAHSRWAPHRTLDFSAVHAMHRADAAACSHWFGLGSGMCGSDQLTAFAAYADSQTPSALDQPFAVSLDSAEVRLSGSGPLTWTAGAFVSLRHDDGTSITRPVNASTGLVEVDTVPTASRRFTGQLNQSALFADAEWRLTSWLGLSAGGRAFDYHRRAWGQVDIASPITGPYEPTSLDQGYRAHGAVGRGRIDIRPDRTLLFYAQVASGFRPGGINIVPGLDASLAAYRDDRLISWEAGTRIQLADKRLRLDVSAYRQHWQHMQYSATSADGGYAFITNIGSAQIGGAEASLSWEPSPIFAARLEATYTDARLASDQTSPTATTPGVKGDRLPYVAPVALSLSLLLDRPMGERSRLLASVHGRYVGRSFDSFRGTGSTQRLAMGDTGTVDADIGIARGGSQATLFVQNLADSRAVTWASVNLSDPQQMRMRRRTVGISLQQSF
jgi:outer membrane receptor protein involved in Fe transport